MKRAAALAVVSLSCSQIGLPQGRPVDWASFGGDARRSGFERSDIRITKDNVKDFQLVLKRKLAGPSSSSQGLTPPVILGLLISYRGFKELGFVTAPSGNVWALDVDTDRLFWQKQLAAGHGSGGCGSMTATPTLTPPATFGGNRGRTTTSTRTPGPGASPSPGLPPTTAGRSTALPARVGGTGFGAPRPLYVISGDGMLHQMNTSDGNDQFPPLPFLPANAKASSLAMHDHVIYTTTSGNCGGVPNAVWAIDMADEDPKPVSFALNGGGVQGTGGLIIGNDGTVYIQTGPGEFDSSANKWSNALVALTPRTLKLKGYFTTGEANGRDKRAPDMNSVTPVAFDYKGKDLVVTAGQDGRLFLLEAQNLGGTDHKTALHQTAPLAAAGGGLWGGLSTWEDADGGRFVAAPVWGAVNADLKVAASGSTPKNGAIVVFKLEEQGEKPVLTPAWVSRDLSSPVPPVITSGIVFALSAGEYTHQGAAWRPKNGGRATLYALDGATGNELYSTGSQVAAPASLTGMTVANGRVYFTTTDSTLYAFGIFLER